MSTSQTKHASYILYTIVMEMKYHVPTKSYIYHTYIIFGDDRNYQSKQITKKHFTSECPLQKTKYHKTNIDPNKFRSQIKLKNLPM